jgi:hypothetical protein
MLRLAILQVINKDGSEKEIFQLDETEFVSEIKNSFLRDLPKRPLLGYKKEQLLETIDLAFEDTILKLKGKTVYLK